MERPAKGYWQSRFECGIAIAYISRDKGIEIRSLLYWAARYAPCSGAATRHQVLFGCEYPAVLPHREGNVDSEPSPHLYWSRAHSISLSSARVAIVSCH